MRVFRDGVIKNDKLEMCMFGVGPANMLQRAESMWDLSWSVVKENRICKEWFSFLSWAH